MATSPATTLCNRLFRGGKFLDDSPTRECRIGWNDDSSSSAIRTEQADDDIDERELLNELLTVFLGGQSDLIQTVHQTKRGNKTKYRLNSKIEPMKGEMVKKCLPLAVYYSILYRFVDDSDKPKAGRVGQALGGAVDELLLTEYAGVVEILERKNRSGQLHLHELRYHVQNVTSSMKTVAELVACLSENKTYGGSTLTALHEYLNKIVAPVALDTDLFYRLAKYSSSPFMKSVQEWIFNGVIYDPFDEFMIVENGRVKKESNPEYYWENKYRIRGNMVPSFLDDVKNSVLKAGKYLNAMKDCAETDGQIVDLPPFEELSYSDDKSYNDVVVRACAHSSRAFLTYLLEERHLMRRIATVKKYFLLQQGDFVVQILDTCDEELSKIIDDIVPSRLATLVEMAVKTPTTDDNITSCLKTLNLTGQVGKIMTSGVSKNENDSSSKLSGYEAFTLTLKCVWPVTLIFNAKVLSVYQMLFRHLFYCKYVERLLCDAWLVDQTCRDLNFAQTRRLVASLSLRNKMLLFVRNVTNYVAEDAVEPAWSDFLRSFDDNCESVDDLMKNHWSFLETVVEGCFLTDPETLSIFRKILDVCKEFATILIDFGSLRRDDDYFPLDDDCRRLDPVFTENVRRFLNRIVQMSDDDSSGKLIKLFYRQNFNHFYNRRFDSETRS